MDILIVDDTETTRKLMRVVLEEAGFTLCEAADGVQALEVLARNSIQLVISDVLMPRMDGYRLAHEIRARTEWRHVRIILYTGSYTSPADERLAFDLGVDKYLKKPITNAELIAAVREVLNQPLPGDTKQPRLADELVVMKEYSQVLVTRLETKNVELEATRQELTLKNQDLHARTIELERAREELRRANEELEARVRDRTAELENANRELESFSHSVSHDLQTPIRAIEAWSAILLGQYPEKFEGECRELLERIPTATQRMKDLINDLLQLSRVTRTELRCVPVDLSRLAASVLEELRKAEPERQVEFDVEPGITTEGDPALLRIVFENLLGNAWKFTRRRSSARIEFGVCSLGEGRPCFIRDNGAGFDMAHAGKLFEPFQRLHPNSQFPGTGIGLATVRRIIDRHGGRIWAESVPNERTTFLFELPKPGKSNGVGMARKGQPGEIENGSRESARVE